MAAGAVLPGATIGVLGGGQLGRMFGQAAQRLGYQLVAYTNEDQSPISQICNEVFVGEWTDESKLKEFAGKAAVVTIEFENIPARALEVVAEHTKVRPHAEVLHVTQNRLREKDYLSGKNFPVAPYAAVKTREDVAAKLKAIGMPAVIKTAGFGYDGKGQSIIRTEGDIDAALLSLGGQDAVLEQFIQFEREISVIGARGADGGFTAYGPIENEHRNHILDVSFVPARMSWTLAEEAIDITHSVMESFDMVGLLCVEFFLTVQGKLLINELAPRPHNSGHYTIEGCPVSQFEQLVRAIAGLPLGSTESEMPVAMANLLGDLWQNGSPDWASALALPEVHLHLYGKKEARPGRKMGHLTARAKWADEAVVKVINARQLLNLNA